jgi:orotidine-5'-phosphate decarboxylase
MKSYLELLRERSKATGAPVCFGLDPDPRRFPVGMPLAGEAIRDFYLNLLERIAAEQALPAVVKPNLAYFEQHTEDGASALREILDCCRRLGLPVLLDAKRGDIGASSDAYARALFEGWRADAVTVSPYMGGDSLAPFTERCAAGKGVYVLCRTSNPGAAEVQELIVDGLPLYLRLAERIAGPWHRDGIGAVLGATAPEPLERAARLFLEAGRSVALLLPGIGTQGGEARRVAALLRRAGYELGICLFSASSGIAEAGLKEGTDDFAGAAVRALQRLQEEIGPP